MWRKGTALCWLCFLISCACYSYDGQCRIVARYIPSSAVNSTESSSAKKNYENVEIFYSNAEDFTITQRLGSGSYGEAYLGHNVTSMEPFVFKLYRFGKLKRKKMLREIFVTQSICGHPNIIKLHHVIKQTLTNYPILFFEYARDTYYRDLYPKLTVEDVRYYMYEILSGLAFAHERGVMHKDLKPANIMIDHEDRTVKIIDWGLSQHYVKDETQSVAGSLYYKSPEMLLDYARSDLSTDIWSLGTVFAAMIFHRPIFFMGTNNPDQLISISNVLGTQGLIDFTAKYGIAFNVSSILKHTERQPWTNLVTPESLPFATPDALHLLDHMLVYDHKRRISAKDALQHPYFRPLRKAREGGSWSTPSASSGGSSRSSARSGGGGGNVQGGDPDSVQAGNLRRRSDLTPPQP